LGDQGVELPGAGADVDDALAREVDAVGGRAQALGEEIVQEPVALGGVLVVVASGDAVEERANTGVVVHNAFPFGAGPCRGGSGINMPRSSRGML